MKGKPLYPSSVTCAETGTYCPTPNFCKTQCQEKVFKLARTIRPRGKSVAADLSALLAICARSNVVAGYDARGSQIGTMPALAVAATFAQVIEERDAARKLLAEALDLLRATRQIAQAADNILAKGSK